jgi:hypothetical protein
MLVVYYLSAILHSIITIANPAYQGMPRNVSPYTAKPIIINPISYTPYIRLYRSARLTHAHVYNKTSCNTSDKVVV